MIAAALAPVLLAGILAAGGDTTRAMRRVVDALPSLVRVDSGSTGLRWTIETDSATGAIGPLARDNHHFVFYLAFSVPGLARSGVGATRAELHRGVVQRLSADTTLVRTLAEAVERREAASGGAARAASPTPRPVSFQRVVDVAARFFYPDSILPNGRIQAHMCVGINGVVDMQGGRDPVVEAFAYSALFHDLLEPRFGIDGEFNEAARLVNAMDLSSDPATRLRRAQGVMWGMMVRSDALRRVLLAEYERARDYLPFRIVDVPARL